MTATTSPKELLGNFRADARQAASDAGAPTNRSSFPGLIIPATGMIYQRGKDLTYKPIAGAPEALTTERLTALLTEENSSTVVSEPAAFAQLQAFVAGSKDEYGTLARRLTISRGLGGSVKLPVLTDALAHRYWLQTELTDVSISDWAKAFGVQAPSPSITLKALIDLASDNIAPSTLGFAAAQKELERTERQIMEGAAWSGIASDTRTYSSLGRFNTTLGSIRSIDPGLLDLHTVDGRVARAVPMNVTGKRFTASVSAPFKLKAGARLRITDGNEFFESVLVELRFGSDTLHGVFELPAKGAGPLMVSRAKSGTVSMFVTDKPFSMFSAKLANERWFSKSVERISGRQVPLDVLLAGAPVE